MIITLIAAGCMLLNSTRSASASPEGDRSILSVRTSISAPFTNQGIELEAISLYEGKLEISIPSDFTVMDAERAKLKYFNARHQPDVVYANERGSVSVAFRLTDIEVEAADLPEVREALEEQLKASALSGFNSSVRTVNGHQYAVFEFMSAAVDTTIYNLIFVTDLDNQMLIGTVNCTEPLLSTYKPVLADVFGSLRKK